MNGPLATWAKRIIQILCLAAIIWATVFHNVLWMLSPAVLMGLLGLAFCLWAAVRIFAGHRESAPAKGIRPRAGEARRADKAAGEHGAEESSRSDSGSLDAPASASPARANRADAPSRPARTGMGLHPVPPLNFTSPWIWAPIAWLGFIVIFQTVPLPEGLVALLSPQGARVAERLAQALPELGGYGWTLSVDPLASRAALPFFALPLMAFVLGNFLASSRRRARGILRFLLILALLEAVYGLIEQLSGHRNVLWISGRSDDAQGTFLNRDHFAATLSLFLPVSIGWLYFRASTTFRHSEGEGFAPPTAWDVLNSRHALWLLTPALLCLGIIQSHSRGGFSSMAFGLGLMFIAGLRSKVARAFGLLGLILAVVLMIYTINSDYQLVLDRFDNLIEKERGGRIATWLNGLEIAADYPLFGIGLGNFPRVYPHYEGLSQGSMPYQAHNEWLEGLLTFGILGMAPLLAGLIVCFAKAFGVMRRGGLDTPWLLGAWCGLLGLMMHGFVEFVFHSPNLSITAALLLGMLLGFERLIDKEIMDYRSDSEYEV